MAYREDRLDGIKSNEGAKLGEKTKLKGTASGTYQMIEGTRTAMYSKMGKLSKKYTNAEIKKGTYRNDPKWHAAEKAFKSDAVFEKAVADEYKKELDGRIPASVQGIERDRKLAIGWYTGDPNSREDVIPREDYGNKLTAGQYADRAVGKGMTRMQSTDKRANNLTNVPTVGPKIMPQDVTALGPPQTPWVGTEPRFRKIVDETSSKASKESGGVRFGMDMPIPTKGTMQKKKGLLPSISADDVIPYVSNLYNMNMKPAAVPQPVMDNPVQLQRVNMSNDRNMATSSYRTMNNGIDQSLDANTGAAVKLANKAQMFQQVSGVNEKERLLNQNIANQEITTNAGIAQSNNAKVYQTRLLNTERENAIKSFQSANLANAADKFVAQRNTKAQYDLEDQKMQHLLDSDSMGVLKKYLDDQKTTKRYGGNLYKAGRMVKLTKPTFS